MENKAFGYALDTPSTDRPIYGYIDSGHTVGQNIYGNVRFVLNDDVGKRTTVTAGDSLRSVGAGELKPTSFTNPSFLTQ